MSNLVTTKVTGFNKIVIHETLAFPNIESGEIYFAELVTKSSWMSPTLHYLQSGELPPDAGEVRNMRRKATKYTLLSRKLYRMGKANPVLIFLEESDIALVLVEVHKVAYSSHISGKALAQKLLKTYYYWPILMKDNMIFIMKYDQC